MKLIPAFVDSWDGTTMRVFIDGYTDGSDVGMRAETCFPLADRPDYTGYHIEKGDAVWVLFNGGDPNSPIVMGFRNQNTGASKDIRRFRHTNFEAHATDTMKQTSKDHEITAVNSINIEGTTITLTGTVKIVGTLETSQTITSSDDVKAGSISLKSHKHTEQGDGADTSLAKM